MQRTLFEEEHDLFRAAFRQFVDKELVPHVDEWEKAGIVDRDVFTKAGANGFLAMDAPETYGGGGVEDFRYNQIISEELQMAGAVGGVTIVRNPIRLARAVMEKSPHVFLVGAGAERFAIENGLDTVSPSWFFTQERWEALQKLQKTDKKGYRRLSAQHKFGTVGAVALDRQGNLAAASLAKVRDDLRQDLMKGLSDPGSGGGKSPRTRAALISLMVAMEADNAETPSRDWWKAREGDEQKGGAA